MQGIALCGSYRVLCTMPLCALQSRALCRRPAGSKGHDISKMINSVESIAAKSIHSCWLDYINSKSTPLTTQGLEF